MQTVSRSSFTTVKTEGAILPADLLQRIADGALDGLQPEAYHLVPSERPNEAISRAWNRCLAVWRSFNEQRRNLPPADSGISLTRERWLLILFQELGYGRLSYQGRIELADGAVYPISHQWAGTPIHLVSFRQELDRRDPAIKRSPHSLMQEFLNRSDALWGFVSNGLTLRVLRDNVSLTRAAYLEFDLEMMMTGEIYADFSLLWLICHQSRVESPPSIPPDGGETGGGCWLEKWSQAAAEQGTRALDALRDGVQDAIGALGRGFLAHPANGELRRHLSTGDLSTQAYYRQLLRLVYRLIFLFVAEDRDLLLLPSSDSLARQRYTDHYSVSRLRRLAEGRRGGPHPDLYRTLRRLFGLLRQGYAPLGLPALGSFLFSERSTPTLDEADLANTDLLEAIRALAFTIEGQVFRPVDYKNLGSEELGSVYESLLELHPQLNIAAASFALAAAAGSERKTTGSYYTPTSLINSLLDSALEPVVKDRLAGKDDPTEAEKALLKIRVVDPAAGSGHFLIAAAHRLAAHLARIRTGDYEPSPTARREALRDVVRHCIHGVDLNEMAVELCKVALWMETLDPGKPLSFLEANIQHGNSLIGATPALLKKGIPDEALDPIIGDDKDYCSEWKTRNKKERGQLVMDLDARPWERLGALAAAMAALDRMESDTLAGVQALENKYDEMVRSTPYLYSQFWADTWCSAFVWPKKPEYQGGYAYPITEATFRQIERNPHDVAIWMKEEIEYLREQYQFFHWHLAFPHVFSVLPADGGANNEQTGWNGGFDVVLGNPPWENLQTDPQEFFAVIAPEIASALNMAQRNKLIEKLKISAPEIHASWIEQLRYAEAVRMFINNSKSYPLTSYGRLNTYSLFAELAAFLLNSTGRLGVILPIGIATDAFNRYFFQNLIENRRLFSLYGFENEEFVFPGIHHAFKFGLITITGRAANEEPELAFYLRSIHDLSNSERRYRLASQDFYLINPNTVTCPVFRNRRDAEITKIVYRRFPVIFNEGKGESPWSIKCQLMLMMNSVSEIALTNEELSAQNIEISPYTISDISEWLPLYEAKMLHQYDHRFGTYLGQTIAQANQGKLPELTFQEHLDPHYRPLPRYWVSKREVFSLLKNTNVTERQWLVAWRDVTSPVVFRTMIAAVLPYSAANDSVPLIHFLEQNAKTVCSFLGNLNSFIFDFVTRQKLGGNHLRFFTFYQLPIIPPEFYKRTLEWCDVDLAKWIYIRVLELTYTAWDLQPFARDCGYFGPPFRWGVERRFLLRCELDAAYFHLYNIERDDVNYIMETFPIIKRRDEATHGEYRTKRVILEIYDEMAEAIRTGQPYRTRLDPPPADLRVAHPWDPAFGEPPAPGQEWVEVERRKAEGGRRNEEGGTIIEKLVAPVAAEKREPYSAKESSIFQQTVETEPLILSHPEPKVKKAKPSKPAPVAQETFLEVMPAPAGPRAARLKRAMALRGDPSAIATRELVAFMADEDSNIRWLAGSSLLHRADADTVAAMAAFLNRAEPERVEQMRAEALRILDLIAETAAEEAVRQAANEALSTLKG